MKKLVISNSKGFGVKKLCVVCNTKEILVFNVFGFAIMVFKK